MSKLSICCVARSDNAIAEFIKRNCDIGVQFITNCKSYFDVINTQINNSDYDSCVIVHDDVVLPRNFPEIARKLVSRLNVDWPDWGVAGNAGMAAWKFGPTGGQIVRFVTDPHGGPNVRGVDIPCSSVDGNVMLVNTKKMREKRVAVPAMDGFQLYDLILCLESLKAGCAVVAVPELTCLHLSGGDQTNFDRFKASNEFKGYLSKAIKVDYFDSLNGRIHKDQSSCLECSGSLDPQYAALLNASNGKERRALDFVIRTQFRSKDLLLRAINSINYFKAVSSKVVETRVVIITDRPIPADFNPEYVDVIHQYVIDQTSDTRFRLIQSYANNCEADFSWFIDDDDWVFPNVAEEISLILSSAPLKSIVFCGSRHFVEDQLDGFNISSLIYSCNSGSDFSALNWPLSLGSENYTPFSGMILPNISLKALSGIAGIDSILYLEDHFILKNALLTCNIYPIVFDSLAVGISIRTAGNEAIVNTVTETDRTKWHISAAQKHWVLNNTKDGYPLYQLFEGISRQQIQSSHDWTVSPTTGSLTPSKKIKRKALLSGLSSILANPSLYRKHWSELLFAAKQDGIRGLKLYLRRSGKAKYRAVFGENPLNGRRAISRRGCKRR